MLAFIDHNITVNVIKDGEIVSKKELLLPKEIRNVIRCKNPRCITSIEQGLPHILCLLMRKRKSIAANIVKRSIPVLSNRCSISSFHEKALPPCKKHAGQQRFTLFIQAIIRRKNPFNALTVRVITETIKKPTAAAAMLIIISSEL